MRRGGWTGLVAAFFCVVDFEQEKKEREGELDELVIAADTNPNQQGCDYVISLIWMEENLLKST